MNEDAHAVAELPAHPNPLSRGGEGIGKIDRLEMDILASGRELLELPTRHRFTPGLYIREVMLKAGTLWTTRRHKTEHPFVLSRGKVTVYTEGGQALATLEAPFTGITKPGTRRCIIVHEDTIWTTFHPTTETDLEKLEELLVEPLAEHLRERHSRQPAAEVGDGVWGLGSGAEKKVEGALP